MKKYISAGILSVFMLFSFSMRAQSVVPTDSVINEPLVISPLFEYPTAPDDLASLEAKTNYLMMNFWNPMDFKVKQPVSQVALNDAFATYTAFMSHANKEMVMKGVDELVKKLSKNPILMIQFVKAAEDNLYGPRAKVWIDEVYLKFLDGIEKCKKVDKSRKVRYADQKRRLLSSMQGNKLASFSYITPEGIKKDYSPAKSINIIEFGNPDCDDCRTSKNYMEVNIPFNELIENGLVSVAFINVEESELDPKILFSSYPREWIVGSNPEIVEQLDIREYPAFYVLDNQGIILGKNLDVVRALALALSKSRQ